MSEEKHPSITEERLLREEILNDLDEAISAFQNNEIDGLGLLAKAVDSWKKANSNEVLADSIKSGLRKQRRILQGFGALDIARHGDPARKRYDPNYWMGAIPKEFKAEKTEEFIIDRMQSLRTFILGLELP